MDSEIKYPTIDDIDIIEMYKEILKGIRKKFVDGTWQRPDAIPNAIKIIKYLIEEKLYKYKYSNDLDIKPYLCDDFDSILKECLTESIYNRVKSLKGFKFRNTEDNILPEDRLSCLNTIDNSRINRVLELGCQWLVG